MKKLIDYLKELGYTSCSKVVGPNGAFISASKADGTKNTFPVGKRSQNGTLDTYNVLITPEGVAIATVNEYKTVESVEFTKSAVLEAVKM